MQKQPSVEHILLHYMDVRAEVSGALTMTNIKEKNMSFMLVAGMADCRKIAALLKRKEVPGSLNNSIIRLCLPASSEWPEFFLDQNGRVFDGSSEYVLNPYAFLKVVDYMDYLKDKNGVKEGGWNNRKKP